MKDLLLQHRLCCHDAFYDELLEENRQLKALIRKLEQRIEELKARLNQNSNNSSKPPSSDRKPSLPPRKKKEQRSYHPGVSCQLLPEEMVTTFEERTVTSCSRCGGPTVPTGDIKKWQQIELPEIKPLVHQWNLQVHQCEHCQATKTARLAPGEQLLLGPRFEAFTNMRRP